jgi:Transglycosylase SLT domain
VSFGATKLMDAGVDLNSLAGLISSGLKIKTAREDAAYEAQALEFGRTGEIPPTPPSITQPPGAAPSRADLMRGPTRFRADIQQVAQQAGLDPRLIEAIVQVESGGDPRAVSPAGAQGLMQLMPETGRAVGVPPEQAFDPRRNVQGGVTYFKSLLERYGGDVPKALTAYHSGPQNVEAGTLGPQGRAYAPRVLARYQSLGGPDVAARSREIAQVDAQINRLQGLPRMTAGIKAQINDLEQRRNRLNQERQFMITETRQQTAEQRQQTAEERQQMAEQRQQQEFALRQRESMLTPEGRAARVEVAEAQREKMPAPVEAQRQVSSLLTMRKAMDDIQDILKRRGGDPTFAAGMKTALKGFTGPIQGFLSTYLRQPFVGEDADENDFVTALRQLTSQEIRASAGLAQTGTEVERAIGFFAGRLPTLSNPAGVFASRLKFLDDIIDRDLEGTARNYQGREYGKFIREEVEKSRERRRTTATKQGEPEAAQQRKPSAQQQREKNEEILRQELERK